MATLGRDRAWMPDDAKVELGRPVGWDLQPVLLPHGVPDRRGPGEGSPVGGHGSFPHFGDGSAVCELAGRSDGAADRSAFGQVEAITGRHDHPEGRADLIPEHLEQFF